MLLLTILPTRFQSLTDNLAQDDEAACAEDSLFMYDCVRQSLSCERNIAAELLQGKSELNWHSYFMFAVIENSMVRALMVLHMQMIMRFINYACGFLVFRTTDDMNGVPRGKENIKKGIQIQ